MQSTLVKTNPGRTLGCSKTNCFPCKNGKGEGGDCRTKNIGYEIGCVECSDVKSVLYHGETSKNTYVTGEIRALKDYLSFNVVKSFSHQDNMDMVADSLIKKMSEHPL